MTRLSQNLIIKALMTLNILEHIKKIIKISYIILYTLIVSQKSSNLFHKVNRSDIQDR